MEITTLAEAKRAAFRGAYRGLRSQGWKPSMSDNNTGACMYNGPKGTHCGVGWIMRKVPIGMNEDPIGDIVEAFATRRKSFGSLLAEPLTKWWDAATEAEKRHFVNFLSDIQELHDKADNAEDMKEAFEAFRKRRKWPVPS